MRKPKYRGYEKLARTFQEQYNDRNFCFPLAACIVSGVSAGKARAAFERAGREHRKGTPLDVGMAALQSLGLEWESAPELEGLQVRSALKQIPEGKYILISRTHAMGVLDGKVDDWTDESGRRKILFAYRFK